MTAALRYGVVGAGRVFQRFHLPCVRDRPELTLAAVCDVDVGRAGAMLGDRAEGVLVTSDLDEFFAVGRLDVVAVCTPNDAHTEPMLRALASGAAVLCEKPVAADIEEARAIARAAAKRRAGVNLPYRFHELIPAFRAAIPDGSCQIDVRFSTAGQRLWRPATAWYGDVARAGGGALLDLGPHVLDLLITLFGRPELVGCRLDRPGVEERAVVELAFAAGPATLHIDRASSRFGLSVEVRHGDAVAVLDLRRNEIRGAAGETIVARDTHPELAAIRRFLDAATGGDADVVCVDEAVRLQEIVAELYAVATYD